jgi:hypothetical protein
MGQGAAVLLAESLCTQRSMSDWTPQTWISLISAGVSVVGAIVSLYWTRRRWQWDAGRELGALRGETLMLISNAKLLDHKTWSMGVREYQAARMAWENKLREKEPLMRAGAFKAMQELGVALCAAEREVFGVVRVFSDDDAEDPDVNGAVSEKTSEQLLTAEKQLADPHFFSR